MGPLLFLHTASDGIIAGSLENKEGPEWMSRGLLRDSCSEASPEPRPDTRLSMMPHMAMGAVPLTSEVRLCLQLIGGPSARTNELIIFVPSFLHSDMAQSLQLISTLLMVVVL